MASTPPQYPKNNRSKKPSSNGAKRARLRASEVSSSTQPPTLLQRRPAFRQLASFSRGAPSSGLLTVKKGEVICPVCNRDMYHKPAFNGHLRWHSGEVRGKYRQAIRRVLASCSVAQGASSSGVQEPVQVSKKKLLDLNELPSDDDEDSNTGA